ncbi:FkbM family methyltransferase [Phenylobacterium sp.]|uniref:FkbM family methyltransferase n=1 Tax=Phenylobacterium sp. TaxID=1871053 RepID=UPI003BAAA809
MIKTVLESLRAEGYAPATLLDIGAHEGRFATGFLAVFPDCVPTLIEPNPHCAETLARLPFERHMVAASREAGVGELFVTAGWLQTTGASLYREDTDYFREEFVVREAVPKIRLDDLLAGRRFDFVKIDTQGSELDVLQGGQTVLSQADYILVEVSLVEFNLGGARAEAVFGQLAAMDFRCAEVVDFHRLEGIRNGELLQMDFLFERRTKRQTATTQRLMDLGRRLAAEGRDDDALTVLENLAALRPRDEAVLRPLLEAYGAHGRSLEALEVLRTLRALSDDKDRLLPEIQAYSLPAVDRFNAHVAAGEIAQAERYAAAMAALVPQNEPMLSAAMTCNQVLGRWTEVNRYARALAAINPRHPAALDALAQVGQAPAPPADPVLAEIADKVALALDPAPDTHPLLRLRDIHDVVSLILCRPLTAHSQAQIQTLLAAAAGLRIEVEPGSEWEGWAIHYRLLLDAVDLAAVNAPTPEPDPEPELVFVSASGAPMDWAGVRATADRLGVEAVFFAAADETYVDLYARWYALSVLKYADVPSLIVIHVIGGADRLAEIAAAVGVGDERLIFAGDAFDADAVTTKVYDAPPKGFIARPVAHFQCVRFLRLGGLLERLERPIFVSDIDLILQRGVADLLARGAGADVMFNENELSLNAGSRLTANLLWVNPTPNAHRLLAFLARYLETQLDKPEVTRWIDQVGLIFARHHLQIRGEAPQIAYFDTETDINNVMYPSYQAHPFRFLSLFHGFDTSSLEGDPRVLGEGAAAQ